MKKSIMLSALVLGMFLVIGCEKKKNNDTAEMLNGQWSIVQITKEEGVVDANSMPQNVTLNACKVSKEDCDGLWISNNGDEGTFSWSVSEKGEMLTIAPAVSGIANQATSDLAEYSGDYLIQELTDVKLLIQMNQITIEFGK